MNNKVKAEKYRRLSIAALITGILAFVCVFPFIAFVMPFIGSFLENFIPEEFLAIFILSFYVICLPIPAIVCGSVDLKRTKAGLFRNKVLKGMDIASIVLGSVFILLLTVYILLGD